MQQVAAMATQVGVAYAHAHAHTHTHAPNYPSQKPRRRTHLNPTPVQAYDDGDDDGGGHGDGHSDAPLPVGDHVGERHYYEILHLMEQFS